MMSDHGQTLTGTPQRLCSEIQLFDLCDLDSCNCKSGRYCSDTELLRRFEKTTERELRVQEQYLAKENDDLENNFDGGDEEGDGFDDLGYGDDDWEDED